MTSATPAATPGTGRATALVLLAACCFGSVVVLTAVAQRAGASLGTVIFWRYLLGAGLLVFVAGGPRRAWVGGRDGLRMLVIGGGGQAAVAWISLTALDYIPAATLGFLFYTYPAWVAIIAAARGTERLDATRIVALVLSLAGILLMVGSPWAAPMHPLGVALALGSALLYAFYIPIIGAVTSGRPPAVGAAHVTFGVALIAILAAPIIGFPAAMSPRAWGAVAVLAVFATAIAFIAFLRGLAVLGAVRTSIISTVEPFWTAILAAVLLGQQFRLATVAGGALIAVAVLLLQRRPRGPSTAPLPAAAADGAR